MSEERKKLWIKVLEDAPLQVRRRASTYLESVQQISRDEWVVHSESEAQYYVRIIEGKATCTCPYYVLEKEYCKHICAVAANELAKMDVLPWLRKIERL